jgi:hypothetical protein
LSRFGGTRRGWMPPVQTETVAVPSPLEVTVLLPEPRRPHPTSAVAAITALLALAGVVVAVKGSPLPSLAAAVIVCALAALHQRP